MPNGTLVVLTGAIDCSEHLLFDAWFSSGWIVDTSNIEHAIDIEIVKNHQVSAVINGNMKRLDLFYEESRASLAVLGFSSRLIGPHMVVRVCCSLMFGPGATSRLLKKAVVAEVFKALDDRRWTFHGRDTGRSVPDTFAMRDQAGFASSLGSLTRL